MGISIESGAKVVGSKWLSRQAHWARKAGRIGRKVERGQAARTAVKASSAYKNALKSGGMRARTAKVASSMAYHGAAHPVMAAGLVGAAAFPAVHRSNMKPGQFNGTIASRTSQQAGTLRRIRAHQSSAITGLIPGSSGGFTL